MHKKENQRVALTRRLLYEALVEILKKKHINQVTVTELCAKAGINRATFYTHYNTPNDILIWMLEKHAAAMTEMQHRQRAGAITSEQQITETCEYLYEHREFFKIIIRNDMDQSIGPRILDEVMRQAATPILLNEGNYDETDCLLIGTYVISGSYKLISKWLIEDLPKTPKEIASLIILLFSRGWLDKM